MAEAILENSLELGNHLVDKHFDKGWDKYRKYVNGKKVDESTTPYHKDKRGSTHDNDAHSSDSSTSFGRSPERAPPAVRSSAQASGGAARTVPLTGAATGAAITASYPGSRRKQRNQLPSPERDIDHLDFRRDSIKSLRQESETSDRVLREYELETDDPKRNPESILPSRDLRKLNPPRSILSSKLKQDSRRDSAMASGYNDNYSQAPYSGEASRPRSQPPRTKYYDDDDSDYDERSGRRYGPRNGRGYDDDRDYDRVVEETERYRGPPLSRPSEHRRESYRSGTDGPYGSGAVTQYGRRSDGALDRQTDTYVSRRSRSRGRDDRDRSYSRSRSRSRSKSRDGIRGQLENAFDTSGRGLGVGLAGAVIGGLAGRQFGHKHRERDIILGAVIGGLGANAAENQWSRWKDNKERDLRDDEQRWENKWEGRTDYGRSRSNVR